MNQDGDPFGDGVMQRIAARIEDMRAEIAAIRDRVELYGRALQIRDAALACQGQAPSEEAARAPSAPASRDIASPATPALPARAEIRANEALRTADGVHMLEYGRAGAFRWTGPGHDARFEVFVDRSRPLRARVTLPQLGDAANEGALELIVDGTAHALARQPGTHDFMAGPIPPRADGGASEIRLRVPHLHWPALSGGLDRRNLGVAFQALVIEPA